MSARKKVQGAVAPDIGARANAAWVSSAEIDVHPSGGRLTILVPEMTLDKMSNTRGNVWIRHAREMIVRDTIYSIMQLPTAATWAESARPKIAAGGLQLQCTVLRERLLDRDGVAAAMKYVVDPLCRTLGIDDSDPRLFLRYQHTTRHGTDFGVRWLGRTGLHVELTVLSPSVPFTDEGENIASLAVLVDTTTAKSKKEGQRNASK